MPAVPHIQVGITNVLQTTGTGLLYRDGSNLVQKLGEYDGSVLTLPQLTIQGSEIDGNGWNAVVFNTSELANSFGVLSLRAGSANHGGGLTASRSADYLATFGIVNGLSIGPLGTAQDFGVRVYLTSASGRRNALFVQNGTGYVGVGTTTPAARLHSAESGVITAPRGIMSSQHTDSVHGARLHLRKSRGTNASPVIVQTGDTLGRLVASGYDGNNYLEMAGIEFFCIGTIGTNRIPTAIAFSTATDASPSVLTERMRINGNGNIGIGTNSPSALLHVAGTTLVNAVAGDPVTIQSGGINALVVDSSRDTNLYRNLIQRGATSGAITHAVPAEVTSYTLTWPSATANGYVKNTGGALEFVGLSGAVSSGIYHSSETVDTISANAVTINFTAANMHYVDYSAQDVACAVNLTAPAGPAVVNVRFKCGGSGAVTWTPSAGTIVWSGGTAPDLSTDGVWKVVGFRYDGAYWLGGVSDTFTIPV